MTDLHFSSLISRSINSWDIGVSILFNLFLVSITILLCFCLFIYCIIPVVKKNTKLKLSLAIPTGGPIILAKEVIDIPQLVADKTINVLSK